MASTTTDSDIFYANGINGSTGTYGFGPLTNAQFAEVLRNEQESEEKIKNALQERNQRSTLMLRILEKRLEKLQAELEQAQDETERRQLTQRIKLTEDAIGERRTLAPREGIDPTDLAQTGWGIIFAEDADPRWLEDVKQALEPLLELRREQATKKNEKFFKIFEKADGYRQGESYLQFLNRQGVGPGPVDPKKGVPYYLLIVGGPLEIPYNFQYQLDVQFAVGRLDFGLDLTEYNHYARSVVATETGQVKLPRTASFFGVSNKHDLSTEKSANHLIAPLYNYFTTETEIPGWAFEHIPSQEATKERLGQLLSGQNSPTVLFTASHGMEFEVNDSRHPHHQGALLCQDWLGPKLWREPIPEKFYFAGSDLSSQTNLLGMMTFHFACYGAGTPEFDEFDRLKNKTGTKRIAKQPFVAELPKQLLHCGALASIGHVERAWGHSFFWRDAGGEQLAVFESTLERLFKGHPIGSALEYFNERYAELATALTSELDNVDFGARPDNLPNLWTAHNDARNYIIIGDPAARLPIAAADETASERPVVERLGFTAPSAAESTPESTANKPLARLSEEDWQNTPPSVQQALTQAVSLIKQLKTQLGMWNSE